MSSPLTNWQTQEETKSLWALAVKGMWLRTIIVSANYGMLNITSHLSTTSMMCTYITLCITHISRCVSKN